MHILDRLLDQHKFVCFGRTIRLLALYSGNSNHQLPDPQYDRGSAFMLAERKWRHDDYLPGACYHRPDRRGFLHEYFAVLRQQLHDHDLQYASGLDKHAFLHGSDGKFIQ
jgi:hypothetical protein